MQFVNKGSTECRTRLPRFWYFFKKVQKERLEENTSERLRLRTAVEFDGERKREPLYFAGVPLSFFGQALNNTSERSEVSFLGVGG